MRRRKKDVQQPEFEAIGHIPSELATPYHRHKVWQEAASTRAWFISHGLAAPSLEQHPSTRRDQALAAWARANGIVTERGTVDYRALLDMGIPPRSGSKERITILPTAQWPDPPDTAS